MFNANYVLYELYIFMYQTLFNWYIFGAVLISHFHRNLTSMSICLASFNLSNWEVWSPTIFSLIAARKLLRAFVLLSSSLDSSTDWSKRKHTGIKEQKNTELNYLYRLTPVLSSKLNTNTNLLWYGRSSSAGRSPSISDPVFNMKNCIQRRGEV